MSRTFRGESLNKIDAKGRMSIPASFRRVIEAGDPNWSAGQNPEMVIVYGNNFRKFLECYTMEAIAEVDAKIKAKPRGTPERRALERMFSGQSLQITVDETGRIVLPTVQREKLELEGEAFFIAAGDTFQIWKPETYAAEEEASTAALLEDLPPDFDPLMFLDDSPAPNGTR